MKLLYCIMLLTLFGCNYKSKRQNLEGIYGKQFCLDVQKTEAVNKVKIGNGNLSFRSDMTFLITNDSAKYSNIQGEWDLCCYENDYGNYVFKVGGLEPWETNIPNLFVIVDSKKIRLFFDVCQ